MRGFRSWHVGACTYILLVVIKDYECVRRRNFNMYNLKDISSWFQLLSVAGGFLKQIYSFAMLWCYHRSNVGNFVSSSNLEEVKLKGVSLSSPSTTWEIFKNVLLHVRTEPMVVQICITFWNISVHLNGLFFDRFHLISNVVVLPLLQ